jgi:hypothetical protein
MYMFLLLLVVIVVTHAAGFTAATLGAGNVSNTLAATLSGQNNKSGNTGSFKMGTTSFSLG